MYNLLSVIGDLLVGLSYLLFLICFRCEIRVFINIKRINCDKVLNSYR